MSMALSGLLGAQPIPTKPEFWVLNLEWCHLALPCRECYLSLAIASRDCQHLAPF